MTTGRSPLSIRRQQEVVDLSVLILDDETALAEALAAALPHEKGVGGAQAASHPDVARSALDRGTVDVVVMSMDSRDWDSVAFLRSTALRFPGLTVVAMSGDDAPSRVTAALLAGAISWVPKKVGVRGLARIVVSSAAGESSVPSALLSEVLRRLATISKHGESKSVLTDLTPRECEVLEHATDGLSREEIAAELDVSVNTVRTHMQHILSKLAVHTTLEAVALVLRERSRGGAGNSNGRVVEYL